ncbi:MAG TPA: hypothetical protein VH165_17870 [Kofleriaceae bacterium]|jgi:hypothetical protein|nr:hypothetical protein [Kofleriaceae bacterium]
MKSRERRASGEKKPRSRWKNASRTSRWSAVSLLGAEETMAAPTVDEKPPEGMPSADPTLQPVEYARDFGRAHELPDVDVACLAQHLGEQLVAPWAIGIDKHAMKLADRDVLIP